MPSSSHRRAFRVRSFSAAIACTASLSLFGSSAFAQATPKDQLQPAVSELISTITEAEADLNNLDLRIGALGESVNEALAILQDSRSEAAQAQRGVSAAQEELADAQSEIASAQEDLDELSRAKYRRAAGSAGLHEISGSDRRDNELYRKSMLRAQSEEKLTTIDELDRVRTEKANKESQLRKTHELAEARAEQATTAESQARELLEQPRAKIEQAQQEREQVAQEREQAREELASARGASNSHARGNTGAVDASSEDASASTASRSAADSALDLTVDASDNGNDESPAETRQAGQSEQNDDVSAELHELINQAAETVSEYLPEHTALDSVPQDNTRIADNIQDPPSPIPALQTVGGSERQSPPTTQETSTAETTTGADAETEGEAVSAESPEQQAAGEQSSQHTADSATGTTTHSADSGTDVAEELSGVLEELSTNESVTEDASAGFAEVAPSQQAQAILSRARSQLGVDYAWGGGNAQGPTAGIRDGGHADVNGDYGKVGFDCSGLVQYAFAGAGISLPHYSGGQYRHGTHVSTSNLQPGDLIFYGPGGSQHVAIYSGNGMMIEAPHSGSHVREVPVRHTGMTENAVRLLG